MITRYAAYTIGLTAFLLISTPILARADTYRLDFKASNFVSDHGNPVPTDPVQGSITFRAASLGAEVEAILAVDLTINGHAYQVSEVGGSRFGTGYLFGGLLAGIDAIESRTNDFWVQNQPGWEDMAYTVDGPAVDSWMTRNVEITITAVPEPSVGSLCAVGLFWLASLRAIRQRQNKAWLTCSDCQGYSVRAR